MCVTEEGRNSVMPVRPDGGMLEESMTGSSRLAFAYRIIMVVGE